MELRECLLEKLVTLSEYSGDSLFGDLKNHSENFSRVIQRLILEEFVEFLVKIKAFLVEILENCFCGIYRIRKSWKLEYISLDFLLKYFKNAREILGTFFCEFGEFLLRYFENFFLSFFYGISSSRESNWIVEFLLGNGIYFLMNFWEFEINLEFGFRFSPKTLGHFSWRNLRVLLFREFREFRPFLFWNFGNPCGQLLFS